MCGQLTESKHTWLVDKLSAKGSLEYQLAVDCMRADYRSMRLPAFRGAIETLLRTYYPRKPMSCIFYAARLFIELECQSVGHKCCQQKLQFLGELFQSAADEPEADVYLRTFGILLVLYPKLQLLQITVHEWNKKAREIDWTELVPRHDKFWKTVDFYKPSARLTEAARHIFRMVTEAKQRLGPGQRTKEMSQVVLGELRVNLKLRMPLEVSQRAEVKERTATEGSKDGGKHDMAGQRSKERAKVEEGMKTDEEKIQSKEGEDSCKEEEVKESPPKSPKSQGGDKSPKKAASRPKKDGDSPKKDASNPKKDASSPKKDASSPKKDANIPKKDANIPKKVTDSSKKDAGSPKKDTGSLKKAANSLKEDTNSPMKDASSPKKDASSPKKDASSPKEDANNPKKDTGSPNPSATCRGPCCVHLRQNLRKYLNDGEISQHRRPIEEMCAELLPHVRRQLWRQLNEEIRIEMAAAMHQDIVEGRQLLTDAMQESVADHYDHAVLSIEVNVSDEWWANEAAEYHASRHRAVLHQLRRYVREEMDRRLFSEAGNACGGELSGSKELKEAGKALSGEFDQRLRDSIREALAENRPSLLELLKDNHELKKE